MSKPTIRILRHMARSGGTLISKCLGCMDGVVLLSEVHPLGQQQLNPVRQAVQWFGLLTAADVEKWRRAGNVPFERAIAEIEKRARGRGDALVLREWSHLDVIGVPYVAPTGRFALGEALASRFDVAQAITVRHPIDQFLSLKKLAVAQGLGIGAYLRGCRVFAEWASAEGFVRYEDFTRDPDGALRTICERLRVPFDEGYRDRWASYETITGDVAPRDTAGAPAAGRGTTAREIRALERRAAPEGLLEEFRRHEDYRTTVELLGYEDA